MRLDQCDRDLLADVAQDVRCVASIASVLPSAAEDLRLFADSHAVEAAYLELANMLNASARKLADRALALHLAAEVTDYLSTTTDPGKPG